MLPSALQQEQWLMSHHLVLYPSIFNNHTSSTCVLEVELAACQDREQNRNQIIQQIDEIAVATIIQLSTKETVGQIFGNATSREANAAEL